MPGALLGTDHIIVFLQHHFYLLYFSLILFSAVELIAGLFLMAGLFSRGSRRHGPTRLNAMENSTNDAFAPEPDLLQMFALTPTGHVICCCLRCPHI
jgi:hypothetical protein